MYMPWSFLRLSVKVLEGHRELLSLKKEKIGDV
jgi:hypothetical protein